MIKKLELKTIDGVLLVQHNYTLPHYSWHIMGPSLSFPSNGHKIVLEFLIDAQFNLAKPDLTSLNRAQTQVKSSQLDLT